MPAAYFVLHNRITDQDGMDKYIPMAVGSLMAAGAEILVVDEDSTVIEGSTDYPRTIVIRFEDREKAMAWYESSEYSAARELRQASTEGYGVLVDEFVMPG